MASEQPPTMENEALSGQIEAIDREIGQLVKTLAWSRRTRMIVFLLVLVFLGVVFGVVYREISRFRSKENLNEMMALVRQRLSDSSTRYRDQVRLLLESAGPVVRDAFLAQAKKDLPRYTAALNEQRDVLLDNLKEQLSEQISQHYEGVVESHKAVLQEEFPEIQDPERLDKLSRGIQMALEEMLKKYYADELTATIGEMYDTWDKFPAAEPPAKDQPPLEDQLIGYLLELVTMKLAGQEQAQPVAMTGEEEQEEEPETPESEQRPAAAPEKETQPEQPAREKPSAESAAKEKRQPPAEKPAAEDTKSKEKPPAAEKAKPAAAEEAAEEGGQSSGEETTAKPKAEAASGSKDQGNNQ